MKSGGFIEVASPGEAVDALIGLHGQATGALRQALGRYLETRRPPSAAERAAFRYPELRLTYEPDGVPHSTRRAYAKFQRVGVYSTTITQPDAFAPYLLEQLQPLVAEYGARMQVGLSRQEMPYPYVVQAGDELGRAGIGPAELARFFPVPRLSAVGDEVADGTYQVGENEPWPLALFDAARVDYSLKRLVHYTGSDWRHVQPYILLTNYHRYVEQFVRWGMAQLGGATRFSKMVLPGNVEVKEPGTGDAGDSLIDISAWSKFQMPAYHLAGEGGGITLVNIGVGPSNAKNITDHLAVLRPHVFLMIGHCGGLRQSQEIGDYVLAHAYLRQDRILDALVPPEIPIPALAEVQVALQEAAAIVTGERGEGLKRRLRTGTIVTNDDRNWELRWSQERHRINLSRAIAVDMESGTIAANGYRLRVPYGTLLCVSDKPLHGEIKLPGAASAFYERAVGQHLQIGLKAVDLLRGKLDQLHTRKLRSFEEPPFR
ncbi:MAG TPA: AMP nucleosidase [Beijerinckiaceae bacterium]|nr:AMP nucleosidase [Beijerinckiaceae bacterium]